MSKLHIPNHTQVPNVILDKLMSKLNGSELKVLLTICRKTIGWHKQTDSISTSQLKDLTGLSNRTVIDAVKSLKKKGVIKVQKDATKTKVYELAYEESSQDVKSLVKKAHKTCEVSSQVAYEKSSHTKEIVTKEREKDKVIVSGKAYDSHTLISKISDEVEIKGQDPDTLQEQAAMFAVLIWRSINSLKTNNQTALKAEIGQWILPVLQMLKEDGRDLREMVNLWRRLNSAEDSFWKKKILSPTKFKRHFDQIAIDLQEYNNANNTFDPTGRANASAYQEYEEDQPNYKPQIV